MIIKPVKKLSGEVSIPGDKSISHRAIMFGSLATGKTTISGFLKGADCISTIGCFRSMGIDITEKDAIITVNGKGLHGLSAPLDILDVGNSGTTTRLISGILSGQNFETVLSGDDSLNSRPMKRIITPLSMMGADISSKNDNGCAPLIIRPSKLKAIHYDSPVASAQVKSCVLLAGMYADGETSVTEPVLSRNHTELMINGFGGNIKTTIHDDGRATAVVTPGLELHSLEIEVPGDISSAAYFIAAGLIVPNTQIVVKNVGINPTRDGILRVVRAMGGNIKCENEHLASGEPVCDLVVSTSSLHGTEVSGEIIPTLIDEIPVIAVIAAFAEGQTVIKDAAELKVKESDRIMAVTNALRAMGGDITPTDDGMIINGGKPLHGGTIDSLKDHRIAMSFAIAALAAEGETDIIDAECVNISYPDFYSTLDSISVK